MQLDFLLQHLFCIHFPLLLKASTSLLESKYFCKSYIKISFILLISYICYAGGVTCFLFIFFCGSAFIKTTQFNIVIFLRTFYNVHQLCHHNYYSQHNNRKLFLQYLPKSSPHLSTLWFKRINYQCINRVSRRCNCGEIKAFQINY